MIDDDPMGGSPPRIADSVFFDRLIQVPDLGVAYEKISDSSCSPTTIRNRRYTWINAVILTKLEEIALEFYDRIVGMELEGLAADGRLVKATCGG